MRYTVWRDFENVTIGRRTHAASASSTTPTAPAAMLAGIRRNVRLNGGRRRKGSLFTLVAPATAAAATAPFAPAFAVGMLDGTLRNDDGVRLRFAFAFRAERFVLRFLLFAHRRNADRRTRCRLLGRVFRKLAKLSRLFGSGEFAASRGSPPPRLRTGRYDFG
jgi:hypothetical protein